MRSAETMALVPRWPPAASSTTRTLASAQDMTVATQGGIAVTSNAGKSWTAKLTQPNGAFWTDLSFPAATTGVIVCSTVNNSLKEVDTVYRTTNAGQTWSALFLP